jgi:hypothetical protein
MTLLQKLTAHANFDVILDRFVDQFISACPPLLRGQLDQVAGLECLTLDSVACTRPGVIFHKYTDGDVVMVDCYGRSIRFPLHANDALEVALGSSPFSVRQLPDSLNDQGKLTLVRRLVREGLVRLL